MNHSEFFTYEQNRQKNLDLIKKNYFDRTSNKSFFDDFENIEFTEKEISDMTQAYKRQAD